ncbi:heparanase-like protein 3 [Rhododendron vialii]|uniref:heparanase-like protein 3 n=1 Tax=Rhododendron vialii TaxID=182163 RepID=UPI00265FEA79|nr:heparanase-like protein 3 [Rhododendron vialii]
MGSPPNHLGLFLWLYYLAISGSKFVASQSNTGAPAVVQGTAYISGTISVGTTDVDFICATLDWWPPQKCDYGTCSWSTASLLNLDLTDIVLLNAIKAFSPLKIRIGGTLQDNVRYQTVGDQTPCTGFVQNSADPFGFTQGCLPMARWDALNVFFKEAGARIIFGLNALTGRTVGSDGTATGAWNSANAESLIKYTINKGYTIDGWEFGNELSGSGIVASVAADQYAADTISLQNLVQKHYRGFTLTPIVLGPGGFFDATWFPEYIQKSQNSLQVVTHHIYNLGAGVDDHLVDKILDPNYLGGESQTFSSLQTILKNSGTSTVAWVGEAGGAYNSGHNHVTNTFVFSFWYLDQLGMAASFDTKTYCRQSLIGGNYGLLNTTTFVPNPDYYSALLFHRLMGRKVLATTFNGTNKVRAYTHCAQKSKGITLLLINLDGNNTAQVEVSISNVIVTQPLNRNSAPLSAKSGVITREEYHLTAANGDFQSQTVLLNGKPLTVDSSGGIPPLLPVRVDPSQPVTVGPYSIVFVHFPSIRVPACK